MEISGKDKKIRQVFTIGIGLLLLLISSLWFHKQVVAFYEPLEVSASVVVDGVDYGVFRQIKTIQDLHIRPKTAGKPFTTVELKRPVVTGPFLYEWAKDTLNTPLSKERNVHIVFRRDGKEISQYVLKDCRPVSLELTSDAAGLYERVELAVTQEISVH